MRVEYIKRELNTDINFIDWSAQPGANNLRPQVESRQGTKVRVRAEYNDDGSVVYTAYIRRYGRVWSNTRCKLPNGKMLRNYKSKEYHDRVVKKQ
jgi:hypothetical protein